MVLNCYQNGVCILSNKLFTVAGTSVLNGLQKYRFATDLKREAILKKNGHTEINLIELPEPMTKEAAINFLGSKDIRETKPSVKAALPKKSKSNKSTNESVAA
jgi:hypothetical protein